MSDPLWNRTVTVEIDGKSTHHVRTTREAAWVLLDEWSAEKGPSYKTALVACANALAEKVPHPIARFLFVAAARDANLEVRISGDINEPDPVLADLTETAFQELFGL